MAIGLKRNFGSIIKIWMPLASTKQVETAGIAVLRQTVVPAYGITRFHLTLRKVVKESGILSA